MSVCRTALASLLLLGSLLLASPVQAAGCQFVLGFADMARAMGTVVGDCAEDQHTMPNGDAQQATTHGLLVWRKADNWTAFTDGYRTWVNGPSGLQDRLNSERFPWEPAPPVAPAPLPLQLSLPPALHGGAECVSWAIAQVTNTLSYGPSNLPNGFMADLANDCMATPASVPLFNIPPARNSGIVTAVCHDGSLSYAAHHQGACSDHGGVASFF